MNELASKNLDLSELVTKAVNIAEQTNSAVITNDDEQQKGFDLLKIIKSLIKAANTERMATTLEAREFVNATNDRYKDEVTAPLTKAQKLLESKLAPYALAKLKAQAEKQRLERERIENEAIAAALLAEKNTEDADEKTDKILEKATSQSAKVDFAVPVRSDHGAVTSTKIVYTFEVIDLSLVPDRYLMLNEALVKKVINATEGKAIPGLKITEGVSMRSS